MTRRLLTVAACFAATTATATAATAPRQASEGGDGPAAPYHPSLAVQTEGPRLKEILADGQPFLCGNAAKGTIPAVDCRVHATIKVPTKVANYLGLSSRVLADGVAGSRTDHYENSDGDDLGRAYFLKLSSAVRTKLKGAMHSKHVAGIAVSTSGSVSSADGDQAYCQDAKTIEAQSTPSPKCLIRPEKRLTWNAPEGVPVCWPIAPFWLAITVPYGQRCPKPVFV
jgi:hypothetical protein